ncbi:metal ABC transporter substrate-binding protein [Dehalococcoidia bacterium]|nr:metal ABC transporter substrate-binding protein [Dehalococcoidia bacterium]
MPFDTKYQLIPLILILVALVGCSPDSKTDSGAATNSLAVVTTIYPLQYFAERVGGDQVHVIGLVKPGIDAHMTELTSQNMHDLANADVIISNGLGMEPWLERALEALGEDITAHIVETASLEPALDHRGTHDGHDDEDSSGDHRETHDGHNEEDPHFWLDPISAASQAQLITEAFVTADALNTAYYQDNLATLTRDLHRLDQNFKESLDNCKHKQFVVSHAAFGHLALRYDLQQLEIAGLSHDVAPSARHLGELSRTINDLGLKAVLVEPLHRDDSFSETLASEVDVELLDAHVIGSVTETELIQHGDYFGLMRDNLRSLRTALECHD